MSLIVGLAVVATAGGAYLLTRPAPTASTTVTRTAQATRADVLETVSVSGSVSSTSQRKLNFSSNGKLSTLYVSVGQSVISGQKLARIDTTDLETAYATAQQNLANAQASYQKQLLSASDTQQSLADTQRTSANSVASAQQSLSTLKTNYAAAKTNYGTYSVSATTDTNAFQTDIETTRVQLEAVLAELLTSGQAEVKSAQNSIYLSFTQIANIAANNASQLQPALDDYQRTRNTLLSAVADFDNAFASGADTTASAAAYQTAQVSFSLATSRLSSALDTTSAGFSSIQSNVVSAQGQLTTSVTKYIGPPYDQWRADLSTLYTLIGNEQTRVSTAKLKLQQATSALTAITDVAGGSLAKAAQAVTTAQDNAAQSVRNAQNSVANIPLNLQSAQVSVDNANDAVATAQSNLDAATLTSPTDGVVTAINAQVGETVTSGASGFIVITSVSSLVVHGTVGEADVTKLKLGQAATITLETSGTKLTGKVTAVDPVATISSGVPTYGVDIKIDRVTEGVKPGMTASASVITAKSDGVITVPSQAVKTQSNRTYVLVVKDGVQTQVTVKTGLSNDSVTEITSGLAEGDTVVVSSGKPSAGASQAPGLGGAPNGAPSGGAGGPPGFGGGQ